MGDSEHPNEHQESQNENQKSPLPIATTSPLPSMMPMSFDYHNRSYSHPWPVYPNRWFYVSAPPPTVPLVARPMPGPIHHPMPMGPYYASYPYYAETEHYAYPYHHHRPPMMRPMMNEMHGPLMPDRMSASMEHPLEPQWAMAMPTRGYPDTELTGDTTAYASPGQPPITSESSSRRSSASRSSGKTGPPKRQRSLEGLETELAFLRDESATIGIMLHSLRNAFQANAPMMRISKKPVTSHKQEVDREMRTAYDDLMLQVRQLEKKVEKLESKIKDICEQVAEGKKMEEEEAGSPKRRRLSSSED
ncbi:hypothetical protein DFQ28_002933 [Apophysomyces sp. BC1034]|nr:hypothetical protein DFQ30_009681 [Apophysomyces sp. BC1015]KAG0180659.1 hypothetical protein DFQ29_000219 [Apophysomyces sp. BC1021]KAG0194858.1 hypothetical protein DFQ28_002933 [Apophysomyces sp. BC1034]